jgi:hypothetical protein
MALSSPDGLFVYIVNSNGDILTRQLADVQSRLVVGSTMRTSTSSVPFVNTMTKIIGASLLNIPAGVWSISTGWVFDASSAVGDGDFHVKYGLSYSSTGFEILSKNRPYSISFGDATTYESYAECIIVNIIRPETIYLNAFINNGTTTATGALMNKSFLNATLITDFASPMEFNPFKTILYNKPPWARYSGSSFNLATNKLLDETGNGRHATCVGITQSSGTGNGSLSNITFIQGTTTSTIAFPTGSIPLKHTICAITRYSSTVAANQGRILASTGSSNNVIIGHHINKRGVVFYGPNNFANGWLTSDTISTGTITNWLNLGYSNVLSSPTNVLVDTVAKGLQSALATPVVMNLAINLQYATTEKSDFQLCQLIIWDQVLTAVELLEVSKAMDYYLINGVFDN